VPQSMQSFIFSPKLIVPDVETCDFIVGTTALEDHRKTSIRAVQSAPLLTRCFISRRAR
jgi:hypothetical protein